MAEIAYVATSFDNPLYAEEMNILDFLKQPDVTIIQALLLKFKPANMDVLPLYIVLLLLFPPILWLLLRQPDRRAGGLGRCSTSLTWEFGWNLPAYPSGHWYFNPFAWQLLFVFGAWCALGGAERLVAGAALAGDAGARDRLSAVRLRHHADLVFPAAWPVSCRTGSSEWMYPIDKTNLDVLRFAHFLALAAVTVRFIPRDWPALKSPLRSGRRSCAASIRWKSSASACSWPSPRISPWSRLSGGALDAGPGQRR